MTLGVDFAEEFRKWKPSISSKSKREARTLSAKESQADQRYDGDLDRQYHSCGKGSGRRLEDLKNWNTCGSSGGSIDVDNTEADGHEEDKSSDCSNPHSPDNSLRCIFSSIFHLFCHVCCGICRGVSLYSPSETRSGSLP